MKFSKYTKELKVRPGKKVDLTKYDTGITLLYHSDDDYEKNLTEFNSELQCFQEKLYAEAECALLIVFQGMDTSGKDGAIAHVMKGVNAQGCRVESFKSPSQTELKHDFLWRTHQAVPERGEIGIFNRSYYEEVLITRVHPDILEKQKLPKSTLHEKHFWRKRFEDIRNHESYLDRQGIRVLKFFLHLSKDEQRKRLSDRVKEPKKNWKISEGDFEERQFWNAYMKAYESCFEETSTDECPWFIIPADDKKNARLLISQILLDEVKKLHVHYPKISPAQKKELKKLKKLL